jgi:tetratricopeptide (TPR) repeat protein
LWEARGEPHRALELLDEADRALAEKDPGNTLRAASIQVCRARLWSHLGKQEKAAAALGKAASGLESGLPEAMQAEIRRLQVVLGVAPGGQAATEPPADQAGPAEPPLESRPVEPPAEAEPAARPAQAEPAATAGPVAAHAEAEAALPGAGSPAVGLEPDLETGPESQPGGEGEPLLSTGALAWDPTLALEQVDTALELLDAGDLPEAERLLLEAGHDLPLPGAPQDLDVMELLPGLLEGLQGVVEGMLSRGWLPRALAVAEYGSSLANQHLAEAFDPEAWPWWGDLELLLGRLHRQMGHLDTAAIYFRRAREIHAAVAGQGVSEEAWRDAFRAAVTGAGTWQDQGALDEADREYSEAVELGIQALAANLPEEVTLARVYMGRGRLRIQSGHPREALPDYECAMDLYLRAYEAGRADLLAELGSSRIGLAEVLYRLGRRDEGEAMRMAAIESMDDLRARGDEEEARGIGQMLIALEEFRSRP